MSEPSAGAEIPVVRDDSRELPIPSVWRPVLRDIVKAFVERDYLIARNIPGLAPVTVETARQIEGYIHDYGEALVFLPDEAWDTSVSMWAGDGWDVLVDLWTEREGRSDLVLSVRVREATEGFEFHVHMVYVP